jgi:hypothetical protein
MRAFATSHARCTPGRPSSLTTFSAGNVCLNVISAARSRVSGDGTSLVRSKSARFTSSCPHSEHLPRSV